MHVAQLAVSSFMFLDIPGQSKLSFALGRHFSIAMCRCSIICNICGRSLLGITRRCLLRTRQFLSLRSSLKFQNSLKSWGPSFGYSGQTWCTTSLRCASTTSWSVHFRISSSLAGLAGFLSLDRSIRQDWCPSNYLFEILKCFLVLCLPHEWRLFFHPLSYNFWSLSNDGWETVQVVDHAHEGLQFCKVLWRWHVTDCFDFVFVRSDSFRSSCETEEGCFVYLELKFVWLESHIVLSRCSLFRGR